MREMEVELQGKRFVVRSKACGGGGHGHVVHGSVASGGSAARVKRRIPSPLGTASNQSPECLRSGERSLHAEPGRSSAKLSIRTWDRFSGKSFDARVVEEEVQP